MIWDGSCGRKESWAYLGQVATIAVLAAGECARCIYSRVFGRAVLTTLTISLPGPILVAAAIVTTDIGPSVESDSFFPPSFSEPSRRIKTKEKIKIFCMERAFRGEARWTRFRAFFVEVDGGSMVEVTRATRSTFFSLILRPSTFFFLIFSFVLVFAETPCHLPTSGGSLVVLTLRRRWTNDENGAKRRGAQSRLDHRRPKRLFSRILSHFRFTDRADKNQQKPNKVIKIPTNFFFL